MAWVKFRPCYLRYANYDPADDAFHDLCYDYHVGRIDEAYCRGLNEEATLQNPADPVTAVPDGSIDFENVSFKYSAKADRNALENIQLHIPSGSTVGVIGGTGSGKSTLVQLIPRLYDATAGT